MKKKKTFKLGRSVNIFYLRKSTKDNIKIPSIKDLHGESSDKTAY